MGKLNWVAAGAAFLGICLMALAGCGGDQTGDTGLPTRRVKMREMKISADLMMAALKNNALDGVGVNARKIQDNLKAVADLYTPDHKEKYISYNQASQTLALAVANAADAGNVKEANRQFRELLPYCGKCHEDCAFLLAPAFPEYEQ